MVTKSDKADTKAANNDEVKADNKAGVDESKDVQTTDQAAKAKADLPTKAEKREESNPEGAATGSVKGGVVDGDSAVAEDWDNETLEGADGTTVEKSLNGDEYEVPYARLTHEHLEVARPRTSDSDDPGKDWTAQHAGGEREDEDGNLLDPVALTPVEAVPGQTFRVGELPNRDVVEAAGINYDHFVTGLPVRADVPDEAPRKGIPA